MKITRIQGQNLACFRDFDLDLASGVLGQASIFAIVGRTGSGKSTLLDTVCLALYGSLPRVEGTQKEQRLDLAGGYVTGTPIAIVRRGSRSAYAACEFVAANGRSYRAVWSVRSTARGGSRGDLALAEPTLHELGPDGSPLGTSLVRNVTGRDERIAELVGLSESEFRRAALLAQNDFASFLRADPKKRAELLEKLTGSSEYSGIGKKVHELGGQAERVAREADRLARALTPWTGEDEQAASTRLADLKATLDAAQAERQALVEERRLGAELRVRQARLEARRAEREAAAERVAAIAPRAEQLRLADQAEGWREAWEADRTATGARVQADLAARTREEQAVRAAAEAERAGGIAVVRREHAVATRAAQRDAAPALASARLLDQGVRAAALAVDDARKQVAQRQSDLAGRVDGARRAVAAAEDARDRHARAGRYLAERRGVGLTLERGDPAQSLRALGALRLEEIKRGGDWQAAVRTADRAGDLASEAEKVRAAALVETEHAEGVLARLGPEPDPGAALAAQRVARDRWDRGLALGAAESAVQTATARLDPKVRRHDVLVLEMERGEAALAVAEARVRESEQELAMALRVRERARAMLSLEEHRPALTDGEPCPLCGATEHPWAVAGAMPGTSAADTVVAEVQSTLDALNRALSGARGEGIRLRAELDLVVAELPALRATLVAAEQELLAARERWGPEPRLPQDALAAAVQAGDREVEQRTEERRTWGLARTAAERAQRVVLDATSAMAPLAAAQAAAVSAARSAELESRAASAATAVALAEASALLAVWPEALDLGDAADALSRVLASVVEWRQVEKVHDELSARLPDLDQAARGAETEQAAARGHLEEGEIELARVTGVQSASLAERAAVLSGRPVDDVEQELQAAVDEAEQLAGEAEALRAAASATAGTAAVETDSARQHAARCAAEAVSAAAALAGALTSAGWTREELEARLMDHAAREQTRRAVLQTSDALHRAEDASEAAEAEVLALVLPEGFDPSTLDERTAAAEATISRADDARTEALADVTRRRDEGERQRAAVAEKERLDGLAQPWTLLRGLIGGDKFRRLAQSRSVDALVELANDQLAVFARRYTLQRHPESDMDLRVCDEESGDELRGTESLSGGETFLVSLALALALGRLSSRSVNVQTLFIDEGFGSLDSETVEPVVDALRKISAGGTQIGVISHVPVIAERVDAIVTVQKQSETSTLRVSRA